MEKILELLDFIGFTINKELAKIAITCSGYGKQYNMITQDSLAIVGDHALKIILTSNKYRENNRITSKELNDYLKELEKNEELQKVAKEYQIEKFLLHHNNEIKGNKKLATSLEAIIGAIYLSEGIERTEEFLEKIGILERKKINILDIIHETDFINAQEKMNDYGYKSLVFCVIDSIYSISATYTSTRNVVKRLSNYLNKSLKDEYIISDFIHEFNSEEGYLKLANIFKNNQRTSAVNGILKSEAVLKYIQVLHSHKIETTRDLLEYKEKETLLADIKKIKGQGSGVTFDYLLMLAGNKDLFKRDRHIVNFFEKYLKVKDASYENLKLLFEKQLEVVKTKYPNYDVRTLDYLIWLFMSNDNS